MINALIDAVITVETAAPAEPIFKRYMNTGSKIAFNINPKLVAYIDLLVSPSALRIPANPQESTYPTKPRNNGIEYSTACFEVSAIGW